jgi:AbrB family looped-hinge helix DNA binding protein
MRTTIDEAGKILLPDAIRVALRLEPGTELEIELHDQSIVLHSPPAATYLKLEGSVLVYTGQLEGDLTNFIDVQREARLRDLSNGLLP